MPVRADDQTSWNDNLGNGFFFSAPNGGWEYPAFRAVALIVRALVGDGAYALLPTPVKAGAAGTVAVRS